MVIKKTLLFVLCIVMLGYVQAQEIKGRTKAGSVNISKDPPKPPYLSIVENSLRFVDADGNDMIDANESCKIKFQLSNSGTGAGLSLKASVKETSAITGLQFDKSTSLGTLSVAKTLDVEIPVKGLMNLVKGKAIFTIAIEELNGFNTEPFNIEVKTREFQAPLVKIMDYTITSEGNTTIQKNKPFAIQILLQNRGFGNADDVVLTLTKPESIYLLGGSAPIDNIGFLVSGATDTIEYSLIIPMTYQENTIPFKFKLSEKYGKYGMDTTIMIVVNQSVSTNTLKVDGKVTKNPEIPEVSLTSDVDKNIPLTAIADEHKYALIIGNEDYSTFQTGLCKETNVNFAVNDAKFFREYCIKTLGVPGTQIYYEPNANYPKMKKRIEQINGSAKNENGNAELIFYYSGHGMPDVQTKEFYLIPVDVCNNDVTSGIKLQDVYDKLTEYPVKKATAFIDACYSGAAGKSIKTKAKNLVLKGNLVVFTSSSGVEPSGVFIEKMHGYFTYFLLKKLKETKGEATYKEISEYLKFYVFKESNNKSEPQTPDVIHSPDVQGIWEKWKLK